MQNPSNPSVLFVCTGNAGRSQMAHAMFKVIADQITVESAGVEPWDNLHPMAERMMARRGISLEGHFPKHVNSVSDRNFDWVITIGDPARNNLPKEKFSGAYWIHWDIADPADADGTAESEAVFQRTMQSIAERLPHLKEKIKATP